MRQHATAPVRKATAKAIPRRTAPAPVDRETPWTQVEIDALREGIAAGLSYGQIRSKHLPQRTRCAIIGKCRRLGIREVMTSIERRTRTSQHINARNLVSRLRRGDVALPPDASADGVTVVDFASLSAQSCRWPIGDPKAKGFGFCGCPKHGDSAYCATHARAAYDTEAKIERGPRLERLANAFGKSRAA